MTRPSLLANLTEERAVLEAALRLVALPSLGVARCRWLLDAVAAPVVVENLLRGRLPKHLPSPLVPVRAEHVDKWRDQLRDQDVSQLVSRNLDGPHQILCAGSGLWPFAIDPDPPVLLFVAGNLELLAAPDRVAVVGTRRCSAVGRSVAREIGFTLADAGVSVVSGLALGIDGAAHDGAGAAPGDPGRVGVVAGGLDMVYPPAHGELWRSIAATGLLMSETPMGERATRWRFPARNRLIAALSQVVVVVESHRSGGALLTVEEALGRSIDVCSVPGSVLSQSSAGSNQLLLDGIPPVRNGSDVLDLLGWSHSQQPALPFPDPVSEDRPGFGPMEQTVVTALQGGAATVDALCVATDLSPKVLLGVVERLRRLGVLTIDGSEVAMVAPGEG